ncbi:MAG: dephospho-CoA kinase [Alphaproteobacteria bacterium]|nr:dephospho-CoA kinase [Alphaproteobacteria bacterium]
MIVIGLTGSIGMGKTTATQVLARMGLPVHDSDAAVHRLFMRGGAAVAAVGEAFPSAIEGGAVNRKTLGSLVFNKPESLARLEAIVHPLVRRETQKFLKQCALRRERIVVLDVPLLFEVKRDGECDLTIVVTAPAFVQAQRVLRRPGMSEQRLAEIRSRQMPDAKKRRYADFVVQTGLGRRESLRRLTHIVKLIRGGCWRAKGRKHA